jgi:hypothetical protein
VANSLLLRIRIECRQAPEETITCTNLFRWYAMHTSAEISVTPGPIYLGWRAQAG